MKFDHFVRAYLECALWTGTDEKGTPLDRDYGVEHFAEEAIKRAIEDCDRFRADNWMDLEGLDEERAGHDFWLTRNRHGAGFWDRGYPKDVETRLTNAAHAFGEIDVYVDEGKVYFG